MQLLTWHVYNTETPKWSKNSAELTASTHKEKEHSSYQPTEIQKRIDLPKINQAENSINKACLILLFLFFSPLKRIPCPSVVEQTSLESSRNAVVYFISTMPTKDTSEHALRRAYRLMVKESHPDKGGSHPADLMISPPR